MVSNKKDAYSVYVPIFFRYCLNINYFQDKLFSVVSTGGVIQKNVFLKISKDIYRKHLGWSLFLIKMQARPATLSKRDSNTGIFL